MRYRELPSMQRRMSVLVMGTLRLRRHDMDTVDSLLSCWLEAGGNVLDCAHEYGEGSSERAIGAWLASSGRRDEVVIISKGCHPYGGRLRVTPRDLAADIGDSLERLQTEHIDVYLLHRDDEAVPVGPLLAALEEHRRAGTIGAYGASNWSVARLEEAHRTARELDLPGFTVSSPQLSLAVPTRPPYPGAVSAGDPASRSWYIRRQMPLLAWSSQAGGFFAGSPVPALSQAYAGAANSERRRRARALASGRGCEPTAVALAWVLRQPFPTFATIGPRSAEELRSSLDALEVELSDDEVRWLNLEFDG